MLCWAMFTCFFLRKELVGQHKSTGAGTGNCTQKGKTERASLVQGTENEQCMTRYRMGGVLSSVMRRSKVSTKNIHTPQIKPTDGTENCKQKVSWPILAHIAKVKQGSV